MNGSPIAVLYDIHGNLAALEAVLAEVEQAGATSYLLGGDYATFGHGRVKRSNGSRTCRRSRASAATSSAGCAKTLTSRRAHGRSSRRR